MASAEKGTEDITNKYENTVRPEKITWPRWVFSVISAGIIFVCAIIALKYLFT